MEMIRKPLTMTLEENLRAEKEHTARMEKEGNMFGNRQQRRKAARYERKLAKKELA